MCGVCGIAVLSQADQKAGPERTAVVESMLEALAHRGPDDVGALGDAGATLGATRLAIRGLTSGKQPFRDDASGVIAVCNGEIDNSAELRAWLAARGRPVPEATDVAVVPGLYLELGDAFLERLVGVFAVAVWDPRAPRLLLARDRAGERPLFYAQAGGAVHFATEIAALVRDPALRLTPDREAIAGYLRFGSFTAPRSPFAEIRKVCPAEVVAFEPAGTRRRRYWRWTIPTEPKREPSVEEFDAILRTAVERQTDVEVDYGVFLSGGIDSSLAAAVTRAVRPDHRLRAYTLRFGEASYDEGGFAGRVARRLGCEQVPVWMKPELLPQGIRTLVRLAGEPLADPAWVPTALLARRAARDVKVALVGEGADELFGGYPTYIGAQVATRYARLPRALRAVVRRAVHMWPPSDNKVTLSFLLKKFVAEAEAEGLARHLLWTSSLTPPLLRRLGVTVPAPRAERETDGELLDFVQRWDLETSLAEGLLTKADRASMQSALELRAPFLDRDVMQFAATLPVRSRVRGITTKAFLKRYALRHLPADIVNRKKRGLSVPLAGWLRGPLRGWADERLRDPLLAEAGVDPAVAPALLAEHCERKADQARAVWTLIVLVEWLRWAAAPGDRGQDAANAPAERDLPEPERT